MQKKQIINVGPAPLGPYSSAVSAGGFVYVSGMLAQDADGALIAGDVAAQTRHILERSRGVLASAGSSLDQAVAVTVYLRSAADFQAMNAAYRTFWEKDPPTRTTVITGLLLDADVEIAMVAATSGAGRRVIHPEGWVRSPNPYSYAIRSGETVFLSGLVPRNGRDNSTVSGDITVQTKAVMENAGELLRAADLDYDDIVSARVYLPDGAVFERMNAVYRSYFTSAPPARATVQAGLAGSGYAVEMTFVATSGTRETFGPGQNLSGAVRAGRHLYVSGVLGRTDENENNVAVQTREVMSRIRRTLDGAGYTASDVVDSLVYLTDLSRFHEMNAEYRTFFQSDFPSRATIGSGLVAPGAVVEIMVTAVKP